MAEKERRLISERTKQALQRAKANGQMLGNPKQAEANRQTSPTFRRIPAPDPDKLKDQPLRAIAAELQRRKIKTERGGTWGASQVANLLKRL